MNGCTTVKINCTERTPTRKELRRYVQDHVQNKWEELADELGLDDDEEVSKKLESLKKRWASDNRKATFEVLKLWQKHYKRTATWGTLLEAISKLQLSNAVDSIKKDLSGK